MAHFESLAEIKDIRGKTAKKGYYSRPPLGKKRSIAIHHSLTTSGSSAAFANYHVKTLGWPRVAYHFVIRKDGTIEWNHSLDIKSYHVGNSNEEAVGICLVGDFRTQHPTKAQLRSLKKLVTELKKDLPSYKVTKGHNEYPGYAWKACPEFDYKAALKAKVSKPSGTNNEPLLQAGDTFNAVKKLQQMLLATGEKLPKYGADGDFGTETEQAVKSFQRAQNITVDGVVGPETWEHLNKAISKDKDWKNKLAVVVADVMNVRHSPDMADDAIAGRVKKDEAFTIIDKVVASNGSTELYKLKSNLYISAHEDYTELKDVPEPEPRDELVIITHEGGLNVRDRLSFDDDAVVGQVQKGEAFTIADTHEVDGTPMFELKSGLFITAHEEYVKVR
ncbi:peptidoglycan recognition protein family protein [Marinococcus halophilus]|uniref:peptidoglycan recognition protein family protein n=1 Tax=Marinococcus halophilus TaxID=1371 RepID=UPI0009A5D37C|nr:N-acetylmuramoyl-L-alanine amidase [Marinococcus halophilus]